MTTCGERRGTDRRQGERRVRAEPLARERRWILDRRRATRRGGLSARLVRYFG